MINVFRRRARFLLERWVQRGALHQLVFVTVLVVLVALLGGILATLLTPAFTDAPTAVWWAFLRLTDPGYLGDDEGTALRVVSTIVTVLGYVLFMGSLIAILTQWLSRTIRNLESGLTPIAMTDHFVILGWTNRTPEIIRKLLTARGRMERFLAARGGARQLRIVVQATEVDAERRQALCDDLGEHWDEGRIFLRSGSSLHEEHLGRLDLLRASAVIVPGADFELGGAELTDTRVVKTLLTVDGMLQQMPRDERPRLVGELFDPRKVAIAKASLDSDVEFIAGDRLISRLMTQGLREPGIATILLGLLTHREGNAVYLRAIPELAGASPTRLARSFPRAVVLGLVRRGPRGPEAHLAPSTDVTLREDDQLILIAEQFDAAVHDPSVDVREVPAQAASPPVVASPETGTRRLLILGWSHKIPLVLEELASSEGGSLQVTILSRYSLEERERALARLDLGPRVELVQIEGDYADEQDLEALAPADFDHIAFLASAWMSSSEEADARTVLGVLLLRSILKRDASQPEVMVELLDPDNARLLQDVADVVFVSPRLLSHLLAHVGLRPELNAVFDALICAGGADVVFRRPAELGLESTVRFPDVQDAAARAGHVALGIRNGAGTGALRVELNPPRDATFHLDEGDRIILLARNVGLSRKASAS